MSDRLMRMVLVLAVIVFAAPRVLHADADNTPERLTKGLSLLQQGKAKEAVLAWGEGSGWTNQQEFIKSTTMVLGVEPATKGPLLRWERVAMVSVSPSVTLYWIALVYERGVHYLWFEVLSNETAQVVTSMSRYDDVRDMATSLAIFRGRPILGGVTEKDSD